MSLPAGTPTGAELRAVFANSGLTLPTDDAPLSAVLGAAWSAWLDDTGFSPFLVPEFNDATTGAVRTFPVIGGMCRFDGGLLRLDAVRIDGQTVEDFGLGYTINPLNAAAMGKPWTWLQFDRAISVRSIHVEGVWGYCTALPDDARLAVLYQAATLLKTQVSLSGASLDLTPGAVRKREDDGASIEYQSAKDYAEVLMRLRAETVSGWREFYKATRKRHRLI